ncbi:IS66 family insertion sequence element accessory protein TnpB [Frigidibacter mobilis]|uniref:IS66 family insertion sequence element accessory protein TnpB n=1 Tax=Frigidibacter mobilis TaxID=1335048 RepID=UPI0009FCD1DA
MSRHGRWISARDRWPGAGRSGDVRPRPVLRAVFVFRSKRADRIKLLVWDQTGMVLVHKRLEDARFVWPQVQGGVMRMSSAQLAALFEGWTGGWSGRNARGVRWWLDDWQNALKSLFLLACKGIP